MANGFGRLRLLKNLKEKHPSAVKSQPMGS